MIVMPVSLSFVAHFHYCAPSILDSSPEADSAGRNGLCDVALIGMALNARAVEPQRGDRNGVAAGRWSSDASRTFVALDAEAAVLDASVLSDRSAQRLPLPGRGMGATTSD